MAAKTVLSDVCDIIRRSDVFHINPDDIHIVDGWNARRDFGDESEMVESIKERGVLIPLLIRKTEDKHLELVDGERRLRAVYRARKEGAEIKSVPVIVANRKQNDADLFFDAIISNNGKPFTPTEQARAFKKLHDWGYSVQDIATRTGKSIATVRNRIELAGASPDVQKAVDAGEITIGEGQIIAKKPNISKQKEALARAKKPKKRQLIFIRKNGYVKQSGLKDVNCDPIFKFIENQDICNQIKNAGFDPETIRITIRQIQ